MFTICCRSTSFTVLVTCTPSSVVHQGKQSAGQEAKDCHVVGLAECSVGAPYTRWLAQSAEPGRRRSFSQRVPPVHISSAPKPIW